MASHEQAVAIAVIGVSGCGKSTFINLASGSNFPVRKSHESCTTELQSSTFSLDGRTVTLIDTPGFDDSVPSVLDVLKLISEYFSRLYSQGVKFAGVMYMHRTAKDRMGDSSRHNFQTFCKFCGDTSLRDVVVVTNTCAEEGSNRGPGDAREPGSVGRDELFAHAVDNGARMLRHDGLRASAHAILRQMINRESTMPPDETESLAQSANPSCTATPVDAMRELSNRVERHTKAFEKLCQAVDTATFTGAKKDKEVLQKEARTSLERMERIRRDLEQLVTDFATEKSQVEDENQRHNNVQVRELAMSESEARQAGGCAVWEHEKMEKEVSMVRAAGQQYVKRFACVAVIFALVCVSRIVLHGSATLLL